MRTSLITLTVLFAGSLSAQNAATADVKTLWGIVSVNLVKSAEKVPEESYAFKPSHDIRSFGQLVGHAADAAYMFCAAAKGEQRAPANVEKEKSGKPELVAAIKDAVNYCNSVIDAMDDAKGMEKVKLFGFEMTRLGILNFNSMHSDEHYGNMVTYMRIRGIVPPSSERR
jgi:uncharacterized damage-inducible protein DinB